MAIFCDALILATLTILAITVTIFILAVAFLGRAIEQSMEEEALIANERREALENTKQKAQKKLDKTTISEEELAEAQRTLATYEKEKRKFEKRQAKALAWYRLLTVKGGVLCPGGTLLLSLAFAVIAKYLTTVSGTAALAFSYILVILAVGGIVWACYRAYKSLSVVQKVATITEEVQLRRTVEAFETALERQEKKLRPKLTLSFHNPKPPFELKPSSVQEIAYSINVDKGSPAKEVVVEFIAPDGLEFLNVEKTHRSAYATVYPNALCYQEHLPNMIGGYHHSRKFTIKLPAKLGSYKLVYVFGCEGFNSAFEEVKVEVVD